MGDTGITYLQGCWNPVEGCTPVSPGCVNCYATARLSRFRLPTTPTLHPGRLDEWLHRRGRVVGVGFQTDLFHGDIPLAFLAEIVCRFLRAPQHTYVMVTKRTDRLLPVLSNLHRVHGLDLRSMKNVWVGATVETQGLADVRAHELQEAPVAHRWLSVEPQIERIAPRWAWFRPNGKTTDEILEAGRVPTIHDPFPAIEWVVQGCESGPQQRRRPFNLEWAAEMQRACQRNGVPYYLKQMPYETDVQGRDYQRESGQRDLIVDPAPRLVGARYVEVPVSWQPMVTPHRTPLDSWREVKEERRRRSVRLGGAG